MQNPPEPQPFSQQSQETSYKPTFAELVKEVEKDLDSAASTEPQVKRQAIIDMLKRNPRELVTKNAFQQEFFSSTNAYALTGYDAVGFCLCKDGLSLAPNLPNFRDLLIHRIIAEAKSRSMTTLHVSSIGPRALGQELLLILAALEAGIKNIKLDLADIYFQDLKLFFSKSMHDFQMNLVREFCKILQVVFKLAITTMAPSNSGCDNMHKYLIEQISNNPDSPVGTININFFYSCKGYAFANQNNPYAIASFIYDMDLDLEPPFLDETISGLREKSPDGTIWFSVRDVDLNFSQEVKKEGVWTIQERVFYKNQIKADQADFSPDPLSLRKSFSI